VIVSAELDRLIHEKRSQLKDAFAAEIQSLESEERDAATRFNAISEELVHLHREKDGEWHITWRGPRPLR